MDINLITKGLLAAWMITQFEPLQNVLTKLRDKSPVYIAWVFVLFGCIKCTAFWVTLGITQDIWSAILASVIAYTYDKVINSLPIRF